MLSAVTVAWISLDIVGHLSLLLLLTTFALVKSLPQRKNPFLINFILTTFLATIPPCLLFITGNQDSKVPTHWICLLQSVLMDGLAPMFGMALVVLVFHTWAELKAILKGETPFTIDNFYMKWALILAPYIAMAAWSTASAVATGQPSAQEQLSNFVYCAATSSFRPVRQYIGLFMIVCGTLEVLFEVWIGCIIVMPIKFDSVKRQKLSSFTTMLYRANIRTCFRLFVFNVLQLAPIILAALNSNHNLGSLALQDATEILESMNGLVTFLVFSTQMDVLRAWKFWNWIRRPETKESQNCCSSDGASLP